MIKGIAASGPFIDIIGGVPSVNYINNFNGAQGVGNMRFNTSTQNMEVWDGSNWITLQSSHASVQLNNEAVRILEWARKAMIKDMELEKLAKENNAVDAALKNLRRAEEQLTTTIILSKETSESVQYHPV